MGSYGLVATSMSVAGKFLIKKHLTRGVAFNKKRVQNGRGGGALLRSRGSFEFPHPILLERVNYPQFELFAQVAGFFMGEI